MDLSNLRELAYYRRIARQRQERIAELEQQLAECNERADLAAGGLVEAIATAIDRTRRTTEERAARDIAHRDLALRRKDAELYVYRGVLQRLGPGGYLTKEECEALVAEAARAAEEMR